MSLWSSITSLGSRVTSQDYWNDVGSDFAAIGSWAADAPTALINNVIVRPADALGDVAPNLGADLGQTFPNLTSGLPQTGYNIGAGVGNLGYYSLSGVGGGLGSGLNSALSGAGSGLGSATSDLGAGLTKPLIYAVLAVVVLLVVLSFATKGRTVSAGSVRVA